MRVCDYISQYLMCRQTEYVFGYQGGAVTPLIDSIISHGLKYVQCYHEQASGFAADAYSRLTGKCSVTVVTNGPGATNVVTAVANAHLDSVPSLFITGQVNTSDLKPENVRQNGFQEIDTVSMVKPFTKYAAQIDDVSFVKDRLDTAFAQALSGRKGAVLLDIPMNILLSEIQEKSCLPLQVFTDGALNDQDIQKAAELLKTAKSPVIVIGGGVRSAEAQNELFNLTSVTGIPTVRTLMGLDVFSKSDIGFSGNYGNVCANLALLNADVVLVLGSRLAKRQIGKDFKEYAPNAKVIQIDVDDAELTHATIPCLAIHADIKKFLTDLNKKIRATDLSSWTARIASWKKQYAGLYKSDAFVPVHIVEKISSAACNDCVVTTDVGQNQMWAAQGWHLKNGQRILSSGGLGCMGFSLPAAVGACFANKGKYVIAFMGDGGLQMNLQELQSVATHHLPVKIFVFNNHSLGMIREAQMKYHDSRFVGTTDGYAVPNLKKLADTYEIPYFLWAKTNIDDILGNKEPALIEIPLTQPITRAMTRFDFPEIYNGGKNE